MGVDAGLHLARMPASLASKGKTAWRGARSPLHVRRECPEQVSPACPEALKHVFVLGPRSFQLARQRLVATRLSGRRCPRRACGA